MCQSKINLSLTFTQRLGCYAHNCSLFCNFHQHTVSCCGRIFVLFCLFVSFLTSKECRRTSDNGCISTMRGHFFRFFGPRTAHTFTCLYCCKSERCILSVLTFFGLTFLLCPFFLLFLVDKVIFIAIA